MALLVVEDDEVIAQAIVDALGEAGYEVDWAKSGEEGLKQVAAKDYELMFLDVMMPGIDGFEVLKRLKADEKTKGVRVVMLTNLGQMSEIDRAMELGAKDYVIKANVDLAKLVELTKTKFLKN